MKAANLIFPHQLFEDNPLFRFDGTFFLIEEYLYFNQYNFHVQKLVFHRSSMKYYEDFLKKKKKKVSYVNQHETYSDIRKFIPYLKTKGFNHINYILTEDNYLDKRILSLSQEHSISANLLDSPMFLNKRSDLDFFDKKKKKFFQTSFYINQRKKFNVLLNNDGKPVGEKWTFDTENRKKYPKGKTPPVINKLKSDDYYLEAIKYVKKYYKNNIGIFSDEPLYPYTHNDAKLWLIKFLSERMQEFGVYEDAIVDSESYLNHSIISPMLNNGLLTPSYVLEKTLNFQLDIPLNSLEGFLRQIIGWREFIRGVYFVKGSYERTFNFFNFSKKIPRSFYDASTGIYPIDDCISKVRKTSYNHHIERLMVLGNFMLLCEFHPDEIYKWFMEHYIDAYDWVMVPNIYGMSQFSDGGLMSTKPYLSSSNYLKKMSNYPKGDWEKIWDGLYWRFINKNRKFFENNIRMKFMINLLDKMDPDKKRIHFKKADTFLKNLI
tara:strand:+ start:2606 stop:4078 length:1473 start_codon:yes stop_codon:yes gene_type:complete